VSTTGEGDAPDSAARFVRRVMGSEARLRGLDFGLLALGDSSYAQYCDFGRRLDTWLQAQGARPLFDRIEVDNGAVDALQRWQAAVEGLAGALSEAGSMAVPETFSSWRLVERRLLNPDGIGGPALPAGLRKRIRRDRLAGRRHRRARATQRAGGGRGRSFRRPAPTRRSRRRSPRGNCRRIRCCWQVSARRHGSTGCHPLPRREYSIASIPEDGRVELVVRQVRDADGALGIGSGC
jgi:sulfite reductase (NADPH) flavoprotein alpha-component